jgi:hypothetical protein
LAAALTSFYLEPKKQALEIYLGILTVSFAAQIGDAFEYLLFSSVSRFIFHHEPRSHPVAKFYNDTRYLGYGIGLF